MVLRVFNAFADCKMTSSSLLICRCGVPPHRIPQHYYTHFITVFHHNNSNTHYTCVVQWYAPPGIALGNRKPHCNRGLTYNDYIHWWLHSLPGLLPGYCVTLQRRSTYTSPHIRGCFCFKNKYYSPERKIY